ncbi:helix-turn-helix domain-containing protein [Geomicrobium sp. JSM 1781026]|uniref:helix-turn-helix domain-containing protein n=1 Tax=Geomicrobium sp. JSM 1781026 TaxID=3344580 RepID=UPI0035C0593D
MKNADFAAYKRLSPYKDVAQLNTAVRRQLYANKHALTTSAIAVYEYLHRSSAKNSATGIGVRCDKYATIAQNTGYSRRTIIRAIKTLVDRCMIVKHATVRGHIDAHNVYVVVRVTAQVSPQGKPSKRRQTSIKQASKGTQARPFKHATKAFKESIEHAPMDATFAHVPSAFATVCRPFFDADLTQKLYRRVLRAYEKHELDYGIDAYMADIVATVKRCIYAWKRGRLRKDFAGYCYAALMRTFQDAFNGELATLYGRT